MSNPRNNMNMQQSFQARMLNCLAFITTGTCYYGKFCHYKHPSPEEVEEDRQRGISQPSSTPCKFFLAGFCKYGAACRFSHALPNFQLHFNVLGLPKRLGTNTCSFYMRNGSCGFGVACKYDHPEPVINQYPHQGYGSYVAVEAEEYQNESDGNTYGWNGDENQYVQQSEPYYPIAESRVYQNEFHGVTNGGNVNQYHQNPIAASNGNQGNGVSGNNEKNVILKFGRVNLDGIKPETQE